MDAQNEHEQNRRGGGDRRQPPRKPWWGGADRRQPHSKPLYQSKTMWVSGIMAALGTVETMAPGIIPPGPTMIAFSAAMAFLRTVTARPVVRRKPCR